MRPRRTVVAGLAVAALAAGTAGAVAAAGGSDESAVLADAANRLGVEPGELRSALSAAEDAQLDQAVKDGDLTQEQADAIKAHREAEGTVLGIGPEHGHIERFGRTGGMAMPGGPGGPIEVGPGSPDDIADALGITPEQLFERFRNGDTLAEIAKAEGKDLADVKAAVKAAALKRLDADVKAGRLTKAQRDEIAEHLADHIADLGEGPDFDHDGPPGFGGRPGPPPPPPPAP